MSIMSRGWVSRSADWKFIGLAHNTLRGAAGGAVLCAETLVSLGYIARK